MIIIKKITAAIIILSFLAVIISLFFIDRQQYGFDVSNSSNGESEQGLVFSDRSSKVYKNADGTYTAMIFPLVGADYSDPDGNVTSSLYPTYLGDTCTGLGISNISCVRPNDDGNIIVGNNTAASDLTNHTLTYRGFVDFNIESIPKDAIINNVTFNFYIIRNQTNTSMIFSVRGLDGPINRSAWNGLHLYNNITYVLNHTNYMCGGYGSLCSTTFNSTGWQTIQFNSNASVDVKSELNNETAHFAIGMLFFGSSISTSDYIEIAGYRENMPYLNVTYTTDAGQKNMTPSFDGYDEGSTGTYDVTGAVMTVGDPSGAVSPEAVGFMTFNTSFIPSGSNVSKVVLRANISSIDALSPKTNLTIVRLNGTFMNSGMGAVNAKNNVTKSPFNYSEVNGLKQGLFDFYLPQTAAIDLNDQLTQQYFSLGFRIVDVNDEFIYFNTAESNAKPVLIVTYNVSSCVPGVSGDWTISTTCDVIGKNYTVAGNVIIQGSGLLNLSGGSNVTLSGNNRYIYVYTGGKIYIYTKSGFNTAR